MGLMGVFASCGDAYEYPWNSEWDKLTPEQEDTTVTEPADTTQTPEPPTEDPEPPTEDPEPPTEDPEPPTEDPEPPTEDPEPEPEPPVDEPEPGPEVTPFDDWTDVSAQYGELPAYLKIYRSPDKLLGYKAVAYVAEADMNQAQWDVWSVKIMENGGNLTEQTDDSFKTPSEVYASQEFPVIINGGYFYYSGSNRYTASFAVSGSEALAYNIGYEYDDAGKMRYPTRAVFRQTSDGTFDACWTYTLWNRVSYMYPAPSEDVSKQPSATYPAGAETFVAQTAIGGGPVLIDDGKIVNTYEQEMFSGISPESAQPRTAIGVTADNKLYFFVCEGRQMTSEVYGYTTGEVAEILLGLGCVEAINLDGGGSSCMLVNGKETIKVSDGSQRAVASTVMIK